MKKHHIKPGVRVRLSAPGHDLHDYLFVIDLFDSGEVVRNGYVWLVEPRDGHRVLAEPSELTLIFTEAVA